MSNIIGNVIRYSPCLANIFITLQAVRKENVLIVENKKGSFVLFQTMILFLVLVLTATFLLTGIAIRDAAKDATTNVQTAVGGKIELNLDTEGHMGSGQQNEWGTVYEYNGDLITEDIVKAIAKVDGVVDYNSEDTAGYYGAGVDFKYLPAALGLSYTQYGEASSYTATLSSEKCSKFQSGKYKLVSGRHIMPEDKHVCLISKELAEYNKLSVGKNIKMYSLDADAISEFEIVGIFDGTEGTSENAMTVDEIPANCGYIDCATLFETFNDILDGYEQLTIYVEDPVSIQNVYDKISALPELKGKTLKLTIDTDEYDVISTPLVSLQKLVSKTMIMIFVVSVIILTLFLTIWIRGRKKEIGIMLSIGRSKANIILQIFTETFIVAVISFAASIPFSFCVAEKIGTFLLSQVRSGEVHLNVQINALYLLPLYFIGILLIAAAVIASSWLIVRTKPKDILTQYA